MGGLSLVLNAGDPPIGQLDTVLLAWARRCRRALVARSPGDTLSCFLRLVVDPYRSSFELCIRPDPRSDTKVLDEGDQVMDFSDSKRLEEEKRTDGNRFSPSPCDGHLCGKKHSRRHHQMTAASVATPTLCFPPFYLLARMGSPRGSMRSSPLVDGALRTVDRRQFSEPQTSIQHAYLSSSRPMLLHLSLRCALRLC